MFISKMQRNTDIAPLLFLSQATSRIIISVNPAATPIVPTLVCFPFCASGINSSTTT